MCFYSVGIVIYNISGLSQEVAKCTFSPIHSHSSSNFLSHKCKKLSANSKLLSPCLIVFPFSKMHVHFLSVLQNTNIKTANPNYSEKIRHIFQDSLIVKYIFAWIYLSSETAPKKHSSHKSKQELD